MSYLSESGRPVQWLHTDPMRPVETAYLGCAYCKHPISDSQRRDAEFCCRITGKSLQQLLTELPPGVPTRNWKVALHLTPLTRESKTNLAAEIIHSGLNASTTDDWQQQRLGHPSESQASSISPEMLRLAMQAPKPTTTPDFTLAGVDVGRSEDWISVIDYWLPKDWREMKPVEIFEKSIRSVRYGAGIVRDRIPEILRECGVEFGLIDNEPSRESSMRICRATCLEMADQVAYLKEILVEGIVEDGGIAEKCWIFRNEKFMGTVLEGFLLKAEDGHSLYRLPEEWEKWAATPSEQSPLRHLSGPWRDPEGQWHRGQGNVDDFYFACVFAEVSFYIKLMYHREYEISGARARPIRKVLQQL